MNLTNDEAAKVIEALNDPKHLGKVQNALAILQAAKDRPQPDPVAWTTQLALECSKRLSGTPHGVIDASCLNIWGDRGVALYTHPPQPAVDKLIEAGDRMRNAVQRIARHLVHGKLELTRSGEMDLFLSMWEQWDAAKSAAPVAAPKVLTDDMMQTVADLERRLYVREHCSGREADIWARGVLSGMMQARDNGYIAPAKVDVETVMGLHEEAIQAIADSDEDMDWHDIDDLRAEFRARLTKLFNSHNP